MVRSVSCFVFGLDRKNSFLLCDEIFICGKSVEILNVSYVCVLRFFLVGVFSLFMLIVSVWFSSVQQSKEPPFVISLRQLVLCKVINYRIHMMLVKDFTLNVLYGFG